MNGVPYEPIGAAATDAGMTVSWFAAVPFEATLLGRLEDELLVLDATFESHAVGEIELQIDLPVLELIRRRLRSQPHLREIPPIRRIGGRRAVRGAARLVM